MVPIKATFQKMTRLVRDLAAKQHKQVQLVFGGEDTELDRNIVEELSDPLVHMIRNSADHGVEMPDVRVAGGKPALGTIHLRAFHQGGNIVIQIQDDGTASSSSSPATRRAACSWTSSSANRKPSSNRSAVRSKRTLRSPAAPYSATVAWASSRMWTRS
jgi:hypothetical protein